MKRVIVDYRYICTAFVLVVLFFSPVIFLDKTFFFRDFHRWFYPMKFYLAESLKNGSMPFWSSNYFCGAPFLSDIQSGVFYPFSLIFLLLPFPKSLNGYIIIHFFLGFYFFYRFIRGLGLSGNTAIFTSISYCYGGYTIAAVNVLNNLSTLIWLPAILWSLHRTIRNKESKSGYFQTTLFICMAILGGEPQLFLMMSMLLFAFILIINSEDRLSLRKIFSRTTIILILIASAVLLTLVQLGTTYTDYHQSVRVGGFLFKEATRFSFDMKMLKHFIIPLHFRSDFAVSPDAVNLFANDFGKVHWLLTIYPGFLIAPLAVFAVFFNFNRTIVFWAAVFTLSLILALGHHTPLYSIFYKIFPGFRFPIKFMFLTGFSLLVLAAYGFEKVSIVLERAGMKAHRLAFLLCFALVIDLFVAHRNLNPTCKSTFYQYHHPDLKPVLDDPETFRVYWDSDISLPSHVPDTIMDQHIQWQMFLAPHLGVLNHMDHVGGNTPLELFYQYLMTRILNKPWEEKIHYLRTANVKYIITSRDLEENPRIGDHIEKVNPHVYKIRNNLPRAWIVGQLINIDKDVAGDLTNDSFDPSTTALTRGEIVDRYGEPYFKSVDVIHYQKDNRIHIEVNAEKAGIVVVSEASYTGWQAFVDGNKKKTLHLNIFFQGVEIDKGRHTIDFIYRPKHFTVFLSITIASWIIFILAWFRIKSKQQ